jgi:glycosyltransferase involved in cell wall biosynthesis
LEKITEELGISDCIKFLGWRDDAVELIGILDVFCLPSLRESFGLVLLEAMAHAKPIVATNVEGIPEVVVDGQTGLLVPHKDPGSLSKAIVYFLTHQEIALEMGKNGQVRLMEKFTLERMRQQYENLYLEAYQKRGNKNG